MTTSDTPTPTPSVIISEDHGADTKNAHDVPTTGIFVGDLDVDEFNRVRVFITSEHEYYQEEELELELYADQVTFKMHSDGDTFVKCTVSYARLHQILAAEVVDQAEYS
jgi:hypothetical protein